jgi:hypothetical protein
MRRLPLLLLAALAGPAAAQIPETYTNLEVLPDDIARPQLVAIMRGFTEALNVRCSTCHVGEEGQPLGEYDFAADDKEMKRTARAMLRMVRAINTEHLADIGGDLEVQCFTCHRGARQPQRLEDALLAAFTARGADSLLSAYRGYRAQYYGRAVFDFGPASLRATAGRLERLDAGVPAAVRVLELQTELFPEDAPSWVQLGATLARAGDTTRAISALERAGTLAGGSPQIQRMLERLRGDR